MASKKKATPFQKAHELTYAVKEVSKDARGDVTHATSWITYQALSSEEKENYFNECIKKTNTLDHHFDHDKDMYEFFLSIEIVEVIIGDLFFHDDEQLKDIDDDDEQSPADAARKKLVKNRMRRRMQ
ncbi:unnamed protein product [Sphagnum balticum]